MSVTSISSAMSSLAANSTTPSHSAQTSFQAAFEQARNTYTPGGENSMGSLLSPLLDLNLRSAQLKTQTMPINSGDMKPGELMMLSMRSHEFLFHCEMVSNVANRASDGVQQLFKQQS